MSELFTIEASLRDDMGKGASRRLRHNNSVPAIVYGGKKAPKTITMAHNKVVKALENPDFHSAVFSLNVDGDNENVILKSLQRHPYKPVIMHMDLQRVTAEEVIEKFVPLRYTNEDKAKGVKIGGKITHLLSKVKIKCQVKDLPQVIEIDMQNVEVGQTLHLSDIVLPEGVSINANLEDKNYNLPVVTLSASRSK